MTRVSHVLRLSGCTFVYVGVFGILIFLIVPDLTDVQLRPHVLIKSILLLFMGVGLQKTADSHEKMWTRRGMRKEINGLLEKLREQGRNIDRDLREIKERGHAFDERIREDRGLDESTRQG